MVDEDGICNPSKNQHFNEVVAARLSRRSVLKGGLAALALGGIGSLVKAMPAAARGRGSLLGFTGIPVSTADTVVVPKGYTARVLIAWGDPVADGPEFEPDASNSAADQARQWGMHNDGVVYFPIDGSRHGLLVQNNEYTDEGLLFPDGDRQLECGEDQQVAQRPRGVDHRDHEARTDDGRRGAAGATGTTSDWHVVRSSQYARRITGQTPIQIGGPAAGDDRLKTQRRSRPAGGCSERSTTAPWASRRGAPTSPARRTSTGSSFARRLATAKPAGEAIRHRRLRRLASGGTPRTRGSTPT